MRRVILESPYAGNVKENVEYARRCVRDALGRNEAPIASHLLYTQKGILNDLIPAERAQGINAGLAWATVAHAKIFYVDNGLSNGMKFSLQRDDKISIGFRSLNSATTWYAREVVLRLNGQDEHGWFWGEGLVYSLWYFEDGIDSLTIHAPTLVDAIEILLAEGFPPRRIGRFNWGRELAP